jgi:hypothetical protein
LWLTIPGSNSYYLRLFVSKKIQLLEKQDSGRSRIAANKKSPQFWRLLDLASGEAG